MHEYAVYAIEMRLQVEVHCDSRRTLCVKDVAPEIQKKSVTRYCYAPHHDEGLLEAMVVSETCNQEMHVFK